MGAPVQVGRYCYAKMFMTANFGSHGRVHRYCHLVISRSLPADQQKIRFTAGKPSVPASCPLLGVIYTSLQGYR